MLLDDGRIGKRHVEQIRGIGDKVGLDSVAKSSNIEILHRIPAADCNAEKTTDSAGNKEVIIESSENLERGEAESPENFEQGEAESSENVERADAESQVENSFRGGREQAEEILLRRSTREKRPPRYLQEYSK